MHTLKSNIAMQNTEMSAREWIEAGKPCTYRYGWGWKGAASLPISAETAMKLLPKFNFGGGFYSLYFREQDGQTVLEFNELSENDMY